MIMFTYCVSAILHLGSVAYRIVHQADCPVLVIR